MIEIKIKSQLYHIQLHWIIIGFITAFSIHLLTRIGLRELYFSIIIFSLTCILFHYSTLNQSKYEKLIINLVLGILAFLIVIFLYDSAITYLEIPKWDFISFYLFSKVGLSKLNFYDPYIFMRFFNNLNLQPKVENGFVSEIVNVGFWYPPPSMFIFLPLGIFTLKTSYIIWQSLIILFLIIDILLLIRYNPLKIDTSHNKVINSALLVILILLFPSIIHSTQYVHSTEYVNSTQYSQTLSIFLFLLIFLIKYIDNWRSGVLLALLIVIKPIAAIFALYLLFFKKWKILTSFVITGSIILLISMLVFGYDSFLNYFRSPPTSRIPPHLFYESTNASLNAVLLRLQLKIFGYVNFEKIKIVTSILSILIILITFYSSKMMAKKCSLFSFMVFIPAGLLIYPNTQYFYIIILIPVVLYFFNQRPFSNNILNLLSLLFLYVLGYHSLFALDIALWIIIVLWSLPPSFRFFYFNKITTLLFQNRNHKLLEN